MFKKKLNLLFFLFSIQIIYSSIYYDYDIFFYNPIINSTNIEKNKEGKNQAILNFFNLKIGDNDFKIDGYWNIFTGMNLSFDYVYYEKFLDWNEKIKLRHSNMDFILIQERNIFMEYINNNFYFSLYSPNDIDKTEFYIKYNGENILKEFIFSNKPNKEYVNPYREINSAGNKNIWTKFEAGNSFYRSKSFFSIDGSKMVIDRFKGNKSINNVVLKASDFEKGRFFYLPDKDIGSNVTIYVSSSTGEDFSSSGINGKFFEKLSETKDYIINRESGTLIFTKSYKERTILINYFAKKNGTNYQCGDVNIGINGILNQYDCNIVTKPELYITHKGIRYLILNSQGNYSFFEEKNSYIFDESKEINNINLKIKDSTGNILTGYSFVYEKISGAIRISKNNTKGDINNIYPFYDKVGLSFYETNYPPENNQILCEIYYEKNIPKMVLSETPIDGTITVFRNSIKENIFSISNNNELILKENIGENDLIEVIYFVNNEQTINLKFNQKNIFKILPGLYIYDSYFLSTPLNFIESSYFDKLNSIELMYNLGIKYKNKNFDIDLSASSSLLIPEIRNITLIDDFERKKTGINLSLDYRYWYPVNLPTSLFPDLTGYTIGKIFYRDMKKNNLETEKYLSIFDYNTKKYEYENNNIIGPYNSQDGILLTDSKKELIKNSFSLINEIELEQNEAVSIVLPLDNINYSSIGGISIALASIDLNKNINLFIDIGKVTEKFFINNEVLNEIPDNGIKYYLNKYGIYLNKGINDGILNSNDLDKNGFIDDDDISKISKAIPENGTTDYLTIEPGTIKTQIFKIVNLEKVANARAIRLTFANPDTTKATGKILINQIRLLESSWTVEKKSPTPLSTIKEVFPAEDSYLINKIFSKNNIEIDKTIHPIRKSERTLKVDIANIDNNFSFSKSFLTPINSKNFKKMGFFLLKKDGELFNLKIILNGNKTITLNNLDYKKDMWHKLSFDIDENEIKNITFLIENINNKNFCFYIDEIFLEEINIYGGGAINFDFSYNNDKIFGKPYILLKTNLISRDFTEREYLTNIYSKWNYLFIGKFNILYTTFNFTVSDKFLIDNKLIYQNEERKINISKNSYKYFPIFFTFLYSYKDTKNDFYSYNKQLYFDIYNNSNFHSVKFYYNSNNNKEGEKPSIETKYGSNINITTELFSNNSEYVIGSKKNKYENYGNYSFDNFFGSIYYDIIFFYNESETKYDNLFIKNKLKLLDFLFFENDYQLKNSLDYTGKEKFYNYNLQYQFTNEIYFEPHFQKKMVTISFLRDINRNSEYIFSPILWENFFEIKNLNNINILPYCLLYPFPEWSIKNSNNFINLKDILKIGLNINEIIKYKYFIPETFILQFIGEYNYKETYNKYILSFEYSGYFSNKYNSININSSYNNKISYIFFNNNSNNEISFQTIHSLVINTFNLKNNSELNYNFVYTNYSDENYINKFGLKEEININFFKTRGETEYGPFFTSLLQLNFEYTLPYKENLRQKPIDILSKTSIGYKINQNLLISNDYEIKYNFEFYQYNIYYNYLDIKILLSARFIF